MVATEIWRFWDLILSVVQLRVDWSVFSCSVVNAATDRLSCTKQSSSNISRSSSTLFQTSFICLPQTITGEFYHSSNCTRQLQVNFINLLQTITGEFLHSSYCPRRLQVIFIIYPLVPYNYRWNLFTFFLSGIQFISSQTHIKNPLPIKNFGNLNWQNLTFF